MNDQQREDLVDTGEPGESENLPEDVPEVEAVVEPTVDEQLAAARAESARVREQLLRTAADFDNFRKRTRREVEDAQRRGREGTVRELLPVFDNLERAISHADEAQDVQSLVDGLRIVFKQFIDVLGKLDVQRVPSVGVPFDPTVHEAIQQLASPDVPAGVVMAEVQPGYTLGGQLLRAAMVVVSKGAPAADAS
jgi:molecular chaperone GrpE